MNINLIAPINQLGYGIVGLNILRELSKICQVTLYPIGSPQVTNKEDYVLAESCRYDHESRPGDPRAPWVKIWHQHDMGFPDHCRGKTVGYPIFELDTFNDLERNELSSVNQLFVCSSWAKNIIELNKIEVPTEVVPLGVDSNIFDHNKKPFEYTDNVIFLNCGKWEIRKGHVELRNIWKELSKLHSNIELWMLCDNPFNTTEEKNTWEKHYLMDNIKIIPRVKTQQEVYNIMSKAHCGIFPSHAEGWNLELLEMMACGKHVIATNYSAHTEFCNENNSDLVDIDNMEIAFDGRWFFGQGEWASIDKKQKDQFVEYMSRFVDTRPNRYPKVNTAGVDTAKKFSWKNTAERLIEHVKETTVSI